MTTAPNIIYIKDSDGDDKADIREVVLTGFTQGNQQLLVNSLRYGMDNWIYGANGRSNGSLHWPDATPASGVQLLNTDFRFKPYPAEERQVEPVSGLSQFGLTIDEWGNRFLSWNTIHIRHVVMERQYLQRNPYLKLADPTAHIAHADHGDAGRVYSVSPAQQNFFREPNGYFNATSGIEVERGGIFPRPYGGSAFVCEPLRNIVHRDELVAAGPTFIARRGQHEQDKEFLASTDSWFRPVNAATGPDGALYVVDFYRETIEHSDLVPEEYRAKIDFYKGADRGRIYRIFPRDAKLHGSTDLSRASARELVEQLNHANGWYRDTAKRLLIERAAAESVIEPLQLMSRHGATPQARIYALASLHGLRGLSVESIGQALSDANAHVREHAVRLLETLPASARKGIDKRVLDRLSQDPDARVRFQVALSLGPADLERDALVRLARKDLSDEWTRAAVLSAVGGWVGDFVLRWLASDDPTFPSTGEMELLLSAGTIAAASADAYQLLSKSNRSSRYGPAGFRTIALLAGISEGWQRGGQNVAEQLSSLAGAERTAIWLALARQTALDGRQPTHIRKVGVQLLAAYGRSEDVSALVSLIDPKAPAEMQEATLAALARSPGDDIPSLLLSRWSSATAGLKREIVRGMLSSDAYVEALLSALETGRLSPSEIEAAPRHALTQWPNATLRERARKQFSMDEARQSVIDRYQSVLTLKGDARKGQKLFSDACSACHRVRGTGGAVGPDLSAVVTRPTRQLIEDILDPSRQVSPDFVNYIASTRDGQVFMGTVASESAANIVLRQMDGTDVTISRERLAELTSTGDSLMPDGLEAALSPQDLADVIAFLRGDDVRAGNVPNATEVVRVTGTHLPRLNHALDVDTVDASMLRARIDIADALRHVRGLDVVQPGGSGRSELFIRGAESNFTAVLIDGVKVNNLANDRGGSFDFTSVEVDEIDRIEVVRGPLSAVYGADALAGAVNLITRQPQESGSMSMGAEIGQHEYQRAHLRVAARLGGTLSSSVQATYRDSGVTVDGFRSRLDAIQGGMQFAEDGDSVTLTARHADVSSRGFPSASGGPKYAASRELERVDATDSLFAVHASDRLNESWSVGLQGSYYERGEEVDSPPVTAGGIMLIPAADARSRFRAGQAVVHSAFVPSEHMQLDAGVEFEQQSGRRSAMLAVDDVLVSANFELDRSAVGAFVEGLISSGWGGQAFMSVRGDDLGEQQRVSTRLSASFLHRDSGIRVTASWADGYKLPSFYALGDSLVGNRNLRAEAGNTAEFTVDWPLLPRRLNVDATAYVSTYENLIDFDFISLRLVNRSQVKVSGADVAVELAADSNLAFAAHVGYADIDIRNEAGELALRPKWRGGISMSWQPRPLWTAQLTWRAVGARFASSIPTGTIRLDTYDCIDVSVSRKLDETVTLTTAIGNILDANYEEDAGVPAPGIAARIGAYARF